MNRILKTNKIIKTFNNYLYDSLMPINLNNFYQFGLYYSPLSSQQNFKSIVENKLK